MFETRILDLEKLFIGNPLPQMLMVSNVPKRYSVKKSASIVLLPNKTKGTENAILTWC